MKDPHPQIIVDIHGHVTMEGSRGHMVPHFKALSTGMDSINGRREEKKATLYRLIHAKKSVAALGLLLGSWDQFCCERCERLCCSGELKK